MYALQDLVARYPTDQAEQVSAAQVAAEFDARVAAEFDARMAKEEKTPPPSNNRHELRTLQDLVAAVTRENLPRLLADLEAFLEMAVRLKPSGLALDLEKLTWIDDGKTTITLEVRLEPPIEAKIERS